MTPDNTGTDRFSMVLVLGTALCGAVVMAGAALALLLMMVHF
jgi:hypothetical protein